MKLHAFTVTGGTCGLRTDDTITCWGLDTFGQTDAPTGSFTTVTAGGEHSCGLRTDEHHHMLAVVASGCELGLAWPLAAGGGNGADAPACEGPWPRQVRVAPDATG